MAEDRRVKGVLITVAGVLVSTPDGLLLRLIASDEWTVLFWRGLLSGLAIFAGLAAVHGRRLPAQILGIGRAGLWAAVFFSAGTVLFVVSITSTTVANALFIVNTAPFFAATIAWLWFNEAVPARTWGAIACALFGVGVIAAGSVGRGGGSLLGDAAAVGAAISVAATFSLARAARTRSMVPAMGIAGFITALAVIPLSATLAVAPDAVIYMGLMGLVVAPLGFSLMVLGPRYLPVPEVSLLLLIEAVLGPLLVWLVVGESPGTLGLVGGAIVIGTLVISNVLALRSDRPARRGGGAVAQRS